MNLKTTKITRFHTSVNEYYRSLSLKNQKAHLLPTAEITIDSFDGLDEALVQQIGQLEPFGEGNPQPVFLIENLTVDQIRKMGDQNQHVKLKLSDKLGNSMQFLAFSAPEHYFVEPGEQVSVWTTLDTNEWMGSKNVEGRLLEVARSSLL